MVCGNFILPEPASYVFFFAVFNLRNLLYIIRPIRTILGFSCAFGVSAVINRQIPRTERYAGWLFSVKLGGAISP